MKLQPWHKRLIAYLGLAIMTIVGFQIVQGQADKATEAAAEAKADAAATKAYVDQIEGERAASAVLACQTRNVATLNARTRFVKLRDNLTLVLGQGRSTPEEIEAINELLFLGIEFDPNKEDRDCNGDGKLTAFDYDAEPVDQVTP